MGRFSTVQAYADNHTGVRKVTYEQATSTGASGGGGVKAAVKPEKVVNPYGSTAGAGSGDFHVYRHARNRELQRQKHMELTAAEQEAEEKFRQEQRMNQEWEEERTAKRRKKRERQKEAKKRKENLTKAGINLSGDSNHVTSTEEEEEEEFQYTPGAALLPIKEGDDDTVVQPAIIINNNDQTPLEIPNDGSFLEKMKQQLGQHQT